MCLERVVEPCVRLQSVLIWPLREWIPYRDEGIYKFCMYRPAYVGLLPSPEQLLAENAF